MEAVEPATTPVSHEAAMSGVQQGQQKGRRRHRSRGAGAALGGKAGPADVGGRRWTGLEQREVLLRLVPPCVRHNDRRELMALLRLDAVQRRESGLLPAPSADVSSTATSTTTLTSASPITASGTGRKRDELTLLQGACLMGVSTETVATLLLNGAAPGLASPVVPLGKAKGGRGTRVMGGYTPLHLALISCGRERNKIVKELLIYGADVNAKDAEGFSFLELTTGYDSPFAALHQLIVQAAKDPRAKKAQEANREHAEVRRRAMEREERLKSNAEVELVDPIDALPPELGLHIFSFLSVAQLARSCQVSTLWRCIATDHDLWRQLYVAQFGPVPPQTEHNFQALLQRSMTLRAEMEARERLAERRQAKLVVQIIHHPHCNHRHHDLQARLPAMYGQHPKRWRGSSLVVAFDASTHQLRVTPSGYYSVNDVLNSPMVRVTHSANECKVRCKNVSGRRTTYSLKVGDKLSVLHHVPQSGVCKVYFFSLTLSPWDDHFKPPALQHYCNR